MNIKKIKKVYLDLKPDIVENQKSNRAKLLDLPEVEDKILKCLLYDKEHYFDKGYFCKYTPEELDKLILERIEELECISAKTVNMKK